MTVLVAETVESYKNNVSTKNPILRKVLQLDPMLCEKSVETS